MPINQNNQTMRGSSAPASGQSEPKRAVEAAVEETKGAIDDASEAVGQVASGAREAVDQLANEAQTIAKEAGETAKSFVEENKGRAAEQIAGITSAITKAADELEVHGQGQFAKYTRDLAGGLDGLSRSINEKGVDDLMGSISQFARSQPAAFLGAAALLGFVSSRFALSTAKPRQPAPSAQSRQWSDESQSADPYLSTANRSGNGSSTYPGGE